jgi:hypothetical protein
MGSAPEAPALSDDQQTLRQPRNPGDGLRARAAIQADAVNLGDFGGVAAAVSEEEGVVNITVSNAALVEQASIDILTPDQVI